MKLRLEKEENRNKSLEDELVATKEQISLMQQRIKEKETITETIGNSVEEKDEEEQT